MLFCPTCHSTYGDGVAVCTRDGSALQPAAPGLRDTAEHEAPVTHDAPTVPSFPAIVTATPARATGSTTVGLGPAGAGTPSFSPSPSPSVSASRALGGSAIGMAERDVPPSSAGGQPAADSTGQAAISAASSEIFDSLVGATLAGRYQIIRRIGEGGMGAVYEARHTIIGKRVAVKVLLEKFLTKSDFVARLLQEARLASAIGHEHIVDVTDFGTTDDGRAFVAMEFLDGESLAQLVMREAPLPVERSLRITRQVASALGAAHAKGIVHRDVKPENVYLIRRGDADFVKVVDFGISKAVKQGQGDDTPDYHLTHTGLLLGTPLYMSPEQARGDEDLDHRVDVWAMGVMLYECLTGEVPFRANNYLGIISQVLTHTALPPSKLRPELGIPEAVEAVVMRAMEKDRSRRYALMADVERDLERLLAGDQNVGTAAPLGPATAPPPRTPARGRVFVWSAAVAALVAGVAMVLARPEPTPPEVETSAVVSPAHPTRAPSSTVSATFRLPAPPKASADRVNPADVTGRTAQRTLPTAGPTSTPIRPAHPPRRPARLERRSATRVAPGSVVEATRPPFPGKAAAKKADDPEIRGVLPSRSGEGYPEN